MCIRDSDDAVADFLRRRMMGDSANKALNDSIGKIDERIALSEDWPGDKGRVEYVAMMHQAFELFVETYPDLVPASIQRDHVYMVRTLAGGQRKMIGYSDWIEPDGTIVDLKFTGSARWNAAGVWAEDWLTEKRDQVCTYYMGRLYAERVGTPDPTSPVIPRGKIVVVCASMYRKNPVVKEHTFTFDDELVAELADAVRDADNVAVSEYHEPRPGEACRWCSYTDRCKNDSRRFAPLTRELAMVPN